MIRQLSVRNFRCLRAVDLRCDGLVALVGPNGSGKSALLHAFRFFFDEVELDEEDCWADDATQPVEVALSVALNDDERFGPYRRDDGTIWVARRSTATESGRETHYAAQRRGNPDFADLRAATAATPARAAYDQLREGGYADLPTWTNFNALPAVLDAWEAEHPDSLEWVEDRSVGFRSGAIQLSEFIEPVFVPAVRDAALEAGDSRTSILRTLIERIVDPKGLFSEAAATLDAEVRERYQAMIGDAGGALDAAAATITARLERFAPGGAVHLGWEGGYPSVSVPGVHARLVEGGHVAEIGRQGHGVQRAYILALLQELAEGAVPDDGIHPLLLMMIEEPELYQHPTRARLLSRTLRELTDGDDARAQVIYATHSPDLIGLDRIDSLRVFRLQLESGHPSTEVTHVDLSGIAHELWTASGGTGEPFTAESLRPRLRLLAQTPVADGFFADGVVLVEGEEDVAFVHLAAADAGVDLDEVNVAVIPVGGKANLDRPLLMFRQLGLPTYVMFDGDRDITASQRAKSESTNRLLTTLLGADPTDSPPTQVGAEWASFEVTLQQTVREEVGPERWAQALREAADEAGYVKVRDASKNPLILLDAYERARAAGGESPTLAAIGEALRMRFMP